MSDIAAEKTDAVMPVEAAAPAAEASTSIETPVAPTETPVVPKEEKKAAPKFDEPLPKLDGKTDEEVQKLLTGASKQSMSLVLFFPHLIANSIVNFYFSDANLPVDRYLFSLTCCNDPLYGWVPIKTLTSFSRMRDPYQGLGVPFVAYALRQQIAADGPDPLLAVSEDGENVRRVRKMERDVNGAWSRTIYVVSRFWVWVKNVTDEPRRDSERKSRSTRRLRQRF